jgi:hypothetical protein
MRDEKLLKNSNTKGLLTALKLSKLIFGCGIVPLIYCGIIIDIPIELFALRLHLLDKLKLKHSQDKIYKIYALC